jgi:hypothetical protein
MLDGTLAGGKGIYYVGALLHRMGNCVKDVKLKFTETACSKGKNAWTNTIYTQSFCFLFFSW